VHDIIAAILDHAHLPGTGHVANGEPKEIIMRANEFIRDAFVLAEDELIEAVSPQAMRDMISKRFGDTAHVTDWAGGVAIGVSTRPMSKGNFAGRYVALATDGTSFIVQAADTADAAKQAVIGQLSSDTKTVNIDDYDIFTAILNVDFVKAHRDDGGGDWYRVAAEGGQRMLIQSGYEMYQNFPDELKELGFQHASILSASRNMIFNITRGDMTRYALKPNMRYYLDAAGKDDLGNHQFIMNEYMQIAHKHQRVHMKTPGLTISAYKQGEKIDPELLE
jgi:hypothetical protein